MSTPIDYNNLKITKRYTLEMNTKRRLKKAILFIFIGLVLFILVSFKWQHYQEEVYHDRTTIMNTNKGYYYEFTASLSNINRIIRNRIFDFGDPSTPSDVSYYYDKIIRISDFNYDYDSYDIDKYSLNDIFYTQKSVIRASLLKEVLTEDEKAGLAAILDANTKILDDMSGITRTYFAINSDYKDHQEEMGYLYYYKGEMFYLLVNSIEVHMADVNYDILDTPRESNIVTLNPPPVLADEASAKTLANLFYTHLVSRPIDLLEVERSTEANENSSSSFLAYIAYKIDDEDYPGTLGIDSDGSVFYRNQDFGKGVTLSNDELLKKADSIITTFNNKDLIYQSLDERELYNQDSDKDYKSLEFTYTISNEDFQDQYSSIHIGFSEKGNLISMTVTNPKLLDDTYDISAIKKDFIPKDEALLLLADDIRPFVTHSIIQNESPYVYQFYFTKYNQEFIAIVQATSGELLNIRSSDN